MHFRGISSTDPMAEAGPTISGVSAYAAGDVVIYSGKEYVLDASGTWHLFGDEGSYALKDSVYTKSETYTRTEVESVVAGGVSAAKAYALELMSWQEMPALA